jgi:hypothetical protein
VTRPKAGATRHLVSVSLACSALAIAALATSGSSAVAQRYRLCDNPRTHYLVVRVHHARCGRARRVARTYFRRLYDLSGGSWHFVFGFRCGREEVGQYFGLAGGKTHCRRGRAQLRAYSRGE